MRLGQETLVLRDQIGTTPGNPRRCAIESRESVQQKSDVLPHCRSLLGR